ncbi:MAG: HipA family kinase [Ktedonobacterales bacterium]
MSSMPTVVGEALRTVLVTRYVAPLREGGSLPGLVEADDDGLYVLKFRGAGQGPRALIAELVVGAIGRLLGLPIPELVFAELDAALGRNEPDYEIRALLRASDGLNLGMDFLPGALTYTPAVIQTVRPPLDAALASAIVWFDAYTTNVDRTPRNPNLLIWGRQLWLIDHGAALYFHHTWENYLERSHTAFAAIKDHVLLPQASQVHEADEKLRPQITPAALEHIVAQIPASWLIADAQFADADAQRAAYVTWLLERAHSSQRFVEEAISARAQLV